MKTINYTDKIKFLQCMIALANQLQTNVESAGKKEHIEMIKKTVEAVQFASLLLTIDDLREEQKQTGITLQKWLNCVEAQAMSCYEHLMPVAERILKNPNTVVVKS